MRTLTADELDAALIRWSGANARLWQFHPSLSRLVLMLRRQPDPVALFVVCVTCRHICGPVSWENAALAVAGEVHEAEHVWYLRDRAVGFEVRCLSGITLVESPFDKFSLELMGATA